MSLTLRLSKRRAEIPPILATNEQVPTAWFLDLHCIDCIFYKFFKSTPDCYIRISCKTCLPKKQIPHSCRKELGSVEVDDGEGGGSPKLAQEGEEYLRFEV